MLLEASVATLGLNERNWETVKAPSEHRQSLVVPDRDTWIGEVTRGFSARIGSSFGTLGSQNWIAELRSLARREIATAATAYVQSYFPNFQISSGVTADKLDFEKDIIAVAGLSCCRFESWENTAGGDCPCGCRIRKSHCPC